MAVATILRSFLLGGSLLIASCADPQEDSAAAAPAPASVSPDQPVSQSVAPSAGQPSLVSPVGLSEPADCKAPEAEAFVGREADGATRAEFAEAVAPITAIRWVGPGDATTEDYSPQRLNVMLDVGGKIVSVHCG